MTTAASPSLLRCDHCLLPFPEKEAVRAASPGGEKVFCCAGCRGVWQLVEEEGLGRFYAERRWAQPGRPTWPPTRW